MARGTETKKKGVEDVSRKSGHYEAFDRQGTVIWSCEDFEAGRSQVPPGISIAMKAGRITDHNGVVIHKWDPSGMFGTKD